MLTLLLVLFLGWVFWWYWSSSLPKNFPPGPRLPLPIIGDAWYLGSDINKGFSKLKKNFGPVNGLYFGITPTVIISDYDLIEDAFRREEFSGRPTPPTAPLIRPGASGSSVMDDAVPGVLFASGKTWVEQRRFALSTLRDFGFGKQGMEDNMEEEIRDVIGKMEKNFAGKPLDVKGLFNITSLNSLWRTLTGERMDPDGDKSKQLLSIMTEMFEEQSKPIWALAIDYYWLIWILKKMNMFVLSIGICKIIDFCQPTIKAHKQTFQEDNMRDFIDAYLREIQHAPKGSSFVSPHGESNLNNLLLDLFIAGSETTSSTLNWAIFYMAKYPDIQAKVQAELEAKIGKGRIPAYKERTETPFTEAVIHEIQRRGNIAGFGVIHSTTSDTSLGPYFLPAKTQVFANLGYVMHNPQHFPDPMKFDPTRHLDPETGKFNPHPKMVAFGIGKRRCLGETLARTSLYKFFIGLVQHFDIKTAEGAPEDMDETPAQGFTNLPKPYKVIFTAR